MEEIDDQLLTFGWVNLTFFSIFFKNPTFFMKIVWFDQKYNARRLCVIFRKIRKMFLRLDKCHKIPTFPEKNPANSRKFPWKSSAQQARINVSGFWFFRVFFIFWKVIDTERVFWTRGRKPPANPWKSVLNWLKSLRFKQFEHF